MKQSGRTDKSFFSNKWPKFFGAAVAAFLLMPATALFAQDRENVSLNEMESFNQTDVDSDQRIGENEFVEWMRDEGIFEDWDADKNQQLTKEEVDKGVKNNYNKVRHVIGNYFIVETNENDGLDTETIANPNLDLSRIDDWDLDNDGYYSEAEMNSGVFDYFDADNDNYVNFEEYNAARFPDQYTD